MSTSPLPPFDVPSRGRAAPVVCVLEDHEMVRETFCNTLRDAGYTVVAASDGLTGMRLIARTRPDVVVTDLIMPIQGGVETIVEIRQRFPAMRIIAVSGGGRTGASDLLDLAEESGADACLAKPFRQSELVACVARMLAERRSDERRDAQTEARPMH